jgi:hypothetical protein
VFGDKVKHEMRIQFDKPVPGVEAAKIKLQEMIIEAEKLLNVVCDCLSSLNLLKH